MWTFVLKILLTVLKVLVKSINLMKHNLFFLLIHCLFAYIIFYYWTADIDVVAMVWSEYIEI